MKRSILKIILVGGIFVLFQAFNLNTTNVGEIPEEVNKALEASCYDCHTTGAKNKDAREALNFEKWDDYRVTKKIGLLGKICELVEEEKMPPAKYLNFNPGKKLSAAQKQLICDWAEKESSALMEGN